MSFIILLSTSKVPPLGVDTSIFCAKLSEGVAVAAAAVTRGKSLEAFSRSCVCPDAAAEFDDEEEALPLRICLMLSVELSFDIDDGLAAAVPVPLLS